jgi:hypothetical protein
MDQTKPSQSNFAQAAAELDSAARPTAAVPPVGNLPMNRPALAAVQPGQPQPAARPAPAAAPATAGPGGPFHVLFHSLLGGVLASALGPKTASQYSVDPDTGKTVTTEVPLTTHDRIRSLVAGALTGLGAAANAPVRPGAPILAGLGAGATAEMQQQRQADLIKRQQANESFEQQQRAILQKANIAHANAQTLNLYQSTLHSENDLDPQRQEAKQLFGDLRQAGTDGELPPGVSAQVMSFDEMNAARQADPTYLTSHLIKPYGREIVSDPSTGDPILGPDGKPKTTGQVLVISLPPGSQNGEMPLPASTYAAYQKFGERAGLIGPGIGELKPGQPVTVEQWLHLIRALDAEKVKEIGGWQEKTPGQNAVINPDSKPTDPPEKRFLQLNPVSGETRPYRGGVPQSVIDRADVLETKETTAAAAKERADKYKSGGGPGTAASKNIQEQINIAKAQLSAAMRSGPGGLPDPAAVAKISAQLADLQNQLKAQQQKAAPTHQVQVGATVTLKNGKTVTVTKVNPDGTFDYK